MSVLSDPGFAKAFPMVIDEEGGFTARATDDGNWTGGKQGVGQLRGTKFGISAAAYPNLDIINITLPQARGIYYRDYWLRMRGPEFPVNLACAMFDCAVNQGRGRVAVFLQRAVGVEADGIIGPATLAAVRRADENELIAAFQAERALDYVTYKRYAEFGRGWFRRVLRTAMKLAK